MPEITLQQAFELALQHHEAGRLAEAETLYRQILAVDPNQPETLHYLGVLGHQVGHHAAAIELIRQALAIRPAWAEALNNLGNALNSHGQFTEAIAAQRQAISLDPGYAVAHHNLGCALYHNGQRDEALVAFGQAIALNPGLADPYSNLGNVLNDNGQLDEAIAAYRQAITLNPNFAVAYNNLGNALTRQGHLDEAIVACRQALALQPDYAEASINLGNALKCRGQLDEAIVAFQQAITSRPNYAEALNNLSTVLASKGQLDEAIAGCRQAIALKPDYAEAHNNLSMFLIAQGQLDDALVALRKAATLQPASSLLASSILLTMHYQQQVDAAALAEAHRAWARAHAEPLRSLIQAHANDRTPERRLRIGYVSPDFREHAVARLLLPLLANHDRRNFEIIAYAQLVVSDPITERMQTLTDGWRNTIGLSDQQMADLVRRDQIDILVDLAGHTAGSRLLVFAQKPAPVQVTCLGYPNTTGLSTIDYRLTDAHADPLGMTEHLHSEQLFRLSESAWCIELAADIVPRARSAGPVTFGCFNNMAKVTEPMLRLWAEILRQVPDSRLLLKSTGLGSSACRERVQKILGDLGVSASRLELRSQAKEYGGHLAQYQEMDLALDPFPYHGTVSTCEALWMGVPVVTLAGQSHVSRVGVSILTNIGLPELIAQTPEEYIQSAVALANDPPRLLKLRSTLRERMQGSPLMDEQKYARQIEAAYRQMWRTWCESRAG